MQTEKFGKPLKVFEFSSTEKDNLNASLEEIEKFFTNPKIKQRKVVILSIVGAFRRGKSFFLDYCLRYLYANVKKIINFICK
jgi:atlastin